MLLASCGLGAPQQCFPGSFFFLMKRQHHPAALQTRAFTDFRFDLARNQYLHTQARSHNTDGRISLQALQHPLGFPVTKKLHRATRKKSRQVVWSCRKYRKRPSWQQQIFYSKINRRICPFNVRTGIQTLWLMKRWHNMNYQLAHNE